MKKGKYYSHVQPRLKEIEQMLKIGMLEKDICKHLQIGRTSWDKYKKEHVELGELISKKEYIDENIEETLERIAQIPQLATFKENLSDDFFKEGANPQDKIRIMNRLFKEDAPYFLLEMMKIRNYEREVEVKEKLAEHEVSGKRGESRNQLIIVDDLKDYRDG